MKIFRVLIHFFGNFLRAVKVMQLRMGGVEIGNNTMISLGAKLDIHKGKIIIGDNCLITHGVTILSHDGSLRLIDPGADRAGKVVIGNNVFVGVNSTILSNVIIGENSVIAAGAVVTKDVPPATVVAGNPARPIRKLEGPFPVLNDPN
jgi:acetyltransferase-like isoleucine patch superfamily enzyme